MTESTNPASVIPQSFFDMLARLVPGAVGLGAMLLLAKSTWTSILVTVFGTSILNEPSHSLTFLSFLFAAYIAGQLISPFAKGVQRLGELEWFGKWFGKWFDSWSEKKCHKWFCKWSAANTKAPKGAYDWLRLHQPQVGALCAKIRGEFTMHNSLSVVFIASAIALSFSPVGFNRVLFTALLVSAFVTAIRGRTTRDTFNQTVGKFAKAAGYPEQDG